MTSNSSKMEHPLQSPSVNSAFDCKLFGLRDCAAWRQAAAAIIQALDVFASQMACVLYEFLAVALCIIITYSASGREIVIFSGKPFSSPDASWKSHYVSLFTK